MAYLSPKNGGHYHSGFQKIATQMNVKNGHINMTMSDLNVISYTVRRRYVLQQLKILDDIKFPQW